MSAPSSRRRPASHIQDVGYSGLGYWSHLDKGLKGDRRSSEMPPAQLENARAKQISWGSASCISIAIAASRTARHGSGARSLLLGAAGVFAATALPNAGAQAATPVAKTGLAPADALKLMKEGNENFGTKRHLWRQTARTPPRTRPWSSPVLRAGRLLRQPRLARDPIRSWPWGTLYRPERRQHGRYGGAWEHRVRRRRPRRASVVVLGHQSCGAVAAAVDVVEKNATFPGVIGEMVQPIVRPY